MIKSELRRLYKQRRITLTPQQVLQWDDLILIQFQRLSFRGDISLLMSYFPIEQVGETDTDYCVRFLQHTHPHIQVCYPVINYQALSMEPHLVDDFTDVQNNRYGIPEPLNGLPVNPTDIDVIFVPLLAFDRQGYRVGYGKGFYDRFLARCRVDVITIGFSYFDPVDKITDTNQYDIPLNYCITPHHLYEF